MMLLALFATPLAACAPAELVDDEGGFAEETDEVKADQGDGGLYTYFLMRQDTRRCAAPDCGGLWVKRAGRSETKCFDGKYASECYVADIDFWAAGLSKVDGQSVRAQAPLMLVRGTIDTHTVLDRKIPMFTATEVWQSSGRGTISGAFYQLRDLGIRCITTPCFSAEVRRLNWNAQTTVSSITGPLGEAAAQHLSSPVMMVGRVETVKKGRNAVVNEFFTKYESPTVCETATDCTYTAYSHPITSSAECYCASCPTALVNQATADANQASWEQHCSNVRLYCIAQACDATPDATCASNSCQVK